jgi:hypothetical protein
MTKMKAKITAAFKMISQFIMDNLPEKENIPLMIIAVIGFICWGYWSEDGGLNILNKASLNDLDREAFDIRLHL